MDVIKLLRSKNRCLQRLLDLSSRFLASSDTLPVAGKEASELNELDDFLGKRDRIFEALDLYDHKISEALSMIPEPGRDPVLAEEAGRVLAEKDRLIQSIILKDNDVMRRIEERKTKILESIAHSRRSRDLVGKFKSTWVGESGEEIDQTL